MDKNASNKNRNQNGEKPMTKYDRKMEARRLQAEKEKKARIRAWITGGAVVAVILAAVLYSSLSGVFAKKAALNDTYISVGEHDLTKLEYDYFYSSIVNNYLTTYASILPYIGLDTSTDFSEQMYDENLTWKDAFDQMTVEQVRQIKALVDDAKKQNFDYDTDADYAAFQTDFAETADEAGVSEEEYYTAVYGTYATESNVAEFIKETLLASAYRDHLTEQNTPSDEDIDAYYEENKKEYDKVDYYAVAFAADVAEDASDDEAKAAMEKEKSRAEEMKRRLEAGEDFETLSEEYFPAEADEEETGEEEDADPEETEETEAHRKTTTYTYVADAYGDWLYDESRKSGDLTVAEDEENHTYHVVKFMERIYDEDSKENISSKLASEKVNEYVEALLSSYEVKDVKGDLKYLTVPKTGEGDDADGADGTDEPDGTDGAGDSTDDTEDGASEDGTGDAADGGENAGDGAAE